MIIIIGTEHGSLGEKSIFDHLNKLKLENRSIEWLCEGYSDNRECKSLTDPEIHLLTDSLFAYMVINDYLKQGDILSPLTPWLATHNFLKEGDMLSPLTPWLATHNFLKEELVSRITEMMITINRQSDDLKSEIYRLFENHFPWMYILQILDVARVGRSEFDVVDKILNRNGEHDIDNNMHSLRALKSLIKKLVHLSHNLKLDMPDINDISNRFLRNPDDCPNCEEILFTQIRERSFWNQIKNQIKPNRLTIITVGSDHCAPLAKMIREETDHQVEVMIG